MSVLLIPDLSEWQGSGIDWTKLVAACPAAIIRAHNGYRADEQFERNRAQAHAAGVRALGLYQYLAPDRDPVDQAAEFVHTIGGIRAGEWPIIDCEEGAHGSERVHAWLGVVSRSLGFEQPWQYAGESYYREQGLAGDGIPAARTWLAAYGQSEPTEPHALWQFTDHRDVAGVGSPVDCSEYHGTIEQLLAAVAGKRTPTPPTGPTPGPTQNAAHPYPQGIHPGGTQPSAKPLQEALKRTGWMDPSTPESDHYGPLTSAGVAGFNQKHGFNDAGVTWDPAIGPHGWALLMTLAYPHG